MKSIVFTGGGSAGHIMPNLAIIDEIKDKYKIYYFGSNGMEKDIIKKYSYITFIEIPTTKFIRSFNIKNLLIPFKLISSIIKTKKLLKEINPSLIFSKGGYVSIPTCLAGNSLKIPILTHESDLTLGLANKIIAHFAKHLCCSFEETANKYKNGIHTGSPIRKKIFTGKKEIIVNRHKLKECLPTILIVGGSLGAQKINECVWNTLDQLAEKYNIIHIVGKNKINQKYLLHKNYTQLEFVSDIENYYTASDLIISRAGSNAIFEILALKKPMLLIPLSKASSRGDQILNANLFKRKSFANVLYEENLSQKTLIEKINETFRIKPVLLNSIERHKINNGVDTIKNLIKDIV